MSDRPWKRTKRLFLTALIAMSVTPIIPPLGIVIGLVWLPIQTIDDLFDYYLDRKFGM